VEQLDLFALLAETNREETELKRADYPDIMTILEADPLRKEAHLWALDYTWHMAIHECPELLKARKEYCLANMKTNHCIRPVVYCDSWGSERAKSQMWKVIADIGHKPTCICPYCSADLMNSKGTIILERRFKGKPYTSVFERRIDGRVHEGYEEDMTLTKIADAVATLLTPEEIQEVMSGEAEIIVDNELRCRKCNEMPEFEPHENTLNGQTWLSVTCKCRRLPKEGFLFGNMDDALEGWRDANEK